MKKTVEYVVRTTVNPITQETQTLPVVVNRREPVDLVDVVANCIDRNLILGAKPTAAQGIAEGIAEQLAVEFKKGNGIPAVDLPDAVAMACLVWDDFVLGTAKCAASCITAPGETHGLVIFYKEGFTYDSMPKAGDANVSVVTRARKDIFVSRLNEILAEG